MVPLLQQGMLCRCKSKVLLPSAVCFPASICPRTFGAPTLLMYPTENWSLPLMQASTALPVGPRGAENSHLIWGQHTLFHGIPKQRNFRCLSSKRIVLTNGRA